MRPLSAIAIALATLCLSPALAATISISSTAPTVDGADIANLTGGTDAGGDQGHIWGNRPLQGQSFTTGSNAGGYQINSVTLRSRSTTTGATFNVVLGSLSGGVMTQIGSTETASPGSYSNGQYITFNFDTPLTLAANTSYGFLWGSTGTGFITDNSANDTAYGGGSAISSGANNVVDLNNVVNRTVDRVFHIDLVAIPEPSAALLALLGGLFLLRRRR